MKVPNFSAIQFIYFGPQISKLENFYERPILWETRYLLCLLKRERVVFIPDIFLILQFF